LHASAIEFIHPHTRAQMVIRAPLDDAFRTLLKALDWGAIAI
jgi:hypothetical protein